MRRNALETLIGALVIVVAIGFVAFSYSKVEIGSASGYEVFAQFERADGLKEGADVRMSGIRVGQIKSLSLDKESFLAVVVVELDDTVLLPDDSSAEIVSESLLGGRFLNLTPGGSEDNLKVGGEVRYTQSPVSLEEMLGKFIFNSGGDDVKK